MARSASEFWAAHDLLQSLRSLAQGWRVGRIMNALSTDYDAAVQMIDTSIVRVHQHGSCVARNKSQSMGRSRGGLTSKIHALVDSSGLPKPRKIEVQLGTRQFSSDKTKTIEHSKVA
jgi:hypothetical protein